jgi:hypothetical protein
MALTEDCFYSHVVETGCCGDQGLLRIPILSVKDIRQQSCKNDSDRIENIYYYIYF